MPIWVFSLHIIYLILILPNMFTLQIIFVGILINHCFGGSFYYRSEYNYYFTQILDEIIIEICELKKDFNILH